MLSLVIWPLLLFDFLFCLDPVIRCAKETLRVNKRTTTALLTIHAVLHTNSIVLIAQANSSSETPS